MTNRRNKKKNFDGTTLVCCAIGVVASINLSNLVNDQVLNVRETAKRAETNIQEQVSEQTTEGVENSDILDVIRQELLTSKREIAPIVIKESEDSYNAEYEQKIADDFANGNEDSVNAEFEVKSAEQQSQNNEKSSTEVEEKKSDVELEENSILTSNMNGYSEYDYELLCEITYAEAGNQTEEQQVAAAATILNRVGSSIFPNTIKEVIMQRGQFASTKNGHIYACGKTVDFSKVPDMTKEAARRALNGEDPTENWLRKEAKRLGLNSENYASGGALYFYSPKFTSPSELVARSNIKCKVQKGGHIFYKVWG